MTSKKENSENTSAYKKRKLINKVANNSKNTDISSMNLKDKQNYFKSQSRTLGGNVSEPFISPLLMNEERKEDNNHESIVEDSVSDSSDSDTEDNNDEIPESPKDNNGKSIITTSVLNFNQTVEKENSETDTDDNHLCAMLERLNEMQSEYEEANMVFNEVKSQKDAILKKLKHLESAINFYRKSL